MSNFSIASILNLPTQTTNSPSPVVTNTTADYASLAIMLEQQAVVMAAFDRATAAAAVAANTDQVDVNQNLKKKRGRKKGSKNRPKDVIMKEKLKRSKSENDSTILSAPNLPKEETCENEFLCAWCKKLFSSAMGRMRHSIHCNWNPERINKLKAKRKKSREEVSKCTPPKTCRLSDAAVPQSSSDNFKSTPLYENGRLIGEKVMPLKRSISEPNHHYTVPDVKVDIKIEQIEEDSVYRELLPNVHVKSEPLN